MKRPSRKSIALAVVLTLGVGAGTAYALWGRDDHVTTAPMEVGGVLFEAREQGNTGLWKPSAGGAPVTVNMPGSTILGVLDQSALDPAPVIWSFTVAGYAQGITGLDFDVAALNQEGPGGTVSDLDDGVARPGTLLALSTMKVYPGSTSGDCSAVPATPAAERGKNVIVFDGDAHTLVAAGATGSARTKTTQTWCVAISYNFKPDGRYVNDVHATGKGADNTSVTDFDQWVAGVGIPPSLDPLGEYRNSAATRGDAVDGSETTDDTEWSAVIFPDTSQEPMVTLSLDPEVTSQRTGVAPGDHFVPPGS